MSLQIRLTEAEAAALQRAAREDDRPVSALARKVLMDWLTEGDRWPTTTTKYAG